MQPQGESVTFTADGKTLLYGSEGRGSSVQPVQVGDGSGGDSKSPSGSGGSGDGPIDTGLSASAVGLVVAVIAVFGIGRLLRRPKK